MANQIITALDNIANTVHDILNVPTQPNQAPTADPSKKQTCLESMGMRMRKEHLRQNMWRKGDIEYSKPLIIAEYEIQTEFKISTAAERADEAEQLAEQRRQEKEAKAAEKQRQKRIKRQKKINDAAAKAKGVPADKQPEGVDKIEKYERKDKGTSDGAIYRDYGYDYA